jgi:hypothetical protein
VEYPEGTRLFFINLPIFAAEVGPAIRLEANRSDLEIYPLTLSPDLYAPSDEVVIEQENEHALLVRLRKGGWFRGRFGEQIQLGWFGASTREMNAGPQRLHPAAGPMPFRVEALRDQHGPVTALRFVFEKPLSDPGYRFFAGASKAAAQPIRFAPADTGSLATAKKNRRKPVPARPVVIDHRDYPPEIAESFRRAKRMQSAFDHVTGWIEQLF